MLTYNRSKYGAVKTQLDGITFDSKKESKMYADLKLLEKAKLIKDLKLQVEFQLQPEFFITIFGETKRTKILPIRYIADFVFFDTIQERIRVIDCKGMKTPEYNLKKKLFAYTFKDAESYIEESI